ncbi:MAG: hypothetical protein VKK62_07240 [Synechococcaceae cyanobacterium]|nr:hypothetical protein [Synechococcaceae cyanobacterium]
MHGSPLQPEDLALLESSLLPSLERHHLRLLAHGLRTLQTIASRREGPPPGRQQIEAWAAKEPLLAGDPGFRSAFLPQLEGLAAQLQAIAAERDLTPLALSLDDLVAWAQQQADQRCGSLNPASQAPPPPPG